MRTRGKSSSVISTTGKLMSLLACRLKRGCKSLISRFSSRNASTSDLHSTKSRPRMRATRSAVLRAVLVEILAHPLAQRGGLAHVNFAAVFIFVDVDARRVGEGVEIFF